MSKQVDTRTKEELKRDGDYTPGYWRSLKKERGWLTGPHGQQHKRTTASRQAEHRARGEETDGR